MTGVSFGGVDLATAVPEALVTRVRRGLIGARRDAYEEVPGRAGSWLFPELPGDRSIIVSVHVLGASFAARRAAVVKLADWLDSGNTALPLIFSDESDRYWLARLSSTPDPDEMLTQADADLEFRAAPYALASTPSTHSWTSTDNVAEVFVIADAVSAFPVLELTAGAGGLPSFILTANGVELAYGTALTPGSKLTISTLAYMITTGANADTNLVGYFDPAHVSMSTADGDFPTLLPGSNSITLDTPGGQTADITATWRRRYRG